MKNIETTNFFRKYLRIIVRMLFRTLFLVDIFVGNPFGFGF